MLTHSRSTTAHATTQTALQPTPRHCFASSARRHIAFGYGIHRCVGARLAELQLRVLLEEIHKRRMRVKVVGDVERVRANFVHGFRKLEVKIEEF